MHLVFSPNTEVVLFLEGKESSKIALIKLRVICILSCNSYLRVHFSLILVQKN